MYIRNLKGINSCRIDKLGRINLFIGKNDVCKSTILEAAYATLKEIVQTNLGWVISRRSNSFVGGRELWYNYDVKNQIVSVVKFDEAHVALTARYNINDMIDSQLVVTPIVRGKPTEKTREHHSSYYGRDWSFRGGSGQQDMLDDLSKPARLEVDSYARGSKFIDSSTRNDLNMLESLLGKLKLQGKDNEFGKYLFDAYGSGRKWEFLPHPDLTSQYRVGLKKGKNRLFLSGVGDGIRFGMLIIASCLLADNTALFIEEIENNQHPESLKKLIPFLVTLSKKSKLQLFVTTHNPIVWSLFEKEFPTETDRKDNFQCYHVLRNQSSGIVECKPKTKQEENEFWSMVQKDLYGD